MTESEKDLQLKLRLMRFFWYNGYFVRRNLNLTRFRAGRRIGDYTDIDVVCIKYDSYLNKQIEICDCKSGANAKTAERIFWLSGVMKYFGANRGYFVRNNLHDTDYIDLANKLNITPLSEVHLNKLEEAFSISSKDFIGPFNPKHKTNELEMFQELKNSLKHVYEYLFYNYWRDPVQQQILNLISCGKRVNDIEIESDSKLFLSLYIITMLTNSLLEFSSYILQISEQKQENEIKERILGGKLESHEILSLMDQFYTFMVKEIELKYNTKYPVNKQDFLNNIYPPYLDHLTDLVKRVCSNPSIYVSAVQLLDFINYEIVLDQDNVNTDLFLKIFGNKNTHVLIKSVKNILVFAGRSEMMSTANLQSILLKVEALDVSTE